jgi:ABC-type branched-subunit amino acid transport system ATPase component
MAARVAVGQAPASADDGAKALEARGLKVHFGGVHAIDGVDLMLTKGEILGLIGPNGAGKTTLVNALSGFQRPTAGRILIGGTDVTGWSPHRLARLGLARTFQSVRMFADLTVLENVELGGVGVGMRRPAARAWARDLLERTKLGGMSHLYGAGLRPDTRRRPARDRGLRLARRPAAAGECLSRRHAARD